jgi:hypothetical protein
MIAATIQPPRSWHPRLAGLAWVTWRQHRVAVAAAATVLAGVTVFMIVEGVQMHADYTRLGLGTCGDLNGRACQAPLTVFEQRYQGVAMYLPRLLEFLPGLLGMFIGAPLVARELESGTFRFAWTQGSNRVRWLLVKLAILGPILFALAAVFSAVFSWWFQPFDPIMGRMGTGQAYEISGVVFAARTLFGLTLGVFVGALLRRTIPAIVTTGAVWLAVAWPSTVLLRPLIQKPLDVPAGSKLITDQGWTIHNWYQNSAGRHLSNAQLDALIRQASGSRHGDGSIGSLLAQHGYTLWSSYEPDSRFWHFQTVESAGYVALAAVLGAASVWWVRRRAA